MKSWEYLAWAGVLVVCLVAGIVLGRWLAPEPVIGLVRFDAVIDLTTAGELIDLLEAARLDNQVAGVVLELTSPGGLATSSENVFYSMLRLRAEKPLIIVVDGLAVSGGYYLAAAANRIYTAASSYVGNIGTRGPRPSDPTLAPDEMSSGPYKLSGGSRFDRIHQLDLVAESFVNNVISQRQNAEINPLQIDKGTVEEARIYLGSEAIAVGLIDLEGGRTDAVLGAAELAGVSRYRVMNLSDYFGGREVTVQPDYTAAVKAMVETAPPEAVFLLDTRIPLPGIQENSAVEQHMLRLKGMLPGAVQPPAAAPAAAPESTEEGT
jgi:protease-4